MTSSCELDGCKRKTDTFDIGCGRCKKHFCSRHRLCCDHSCEAAKNQFRDKIKRENPPVVRSKLVEKV
jgi:predicted nucleic acid binding AN1-type Zn finger protein